LGVAKLGGTAPGRLDVGPGAIMPLRITLDDGSVREWEIVPRTWLAGFGSAGLPESFYPIGP
jgi:hypothetical protein